MKDFRELKVWEKAHQMTLQSYRITEAFPRHELFGLASQIRRCCFSIPANIAEGCGRLGIARDLGYISHADQVNAHKQLLEVIRMLVALTRKVGSERKPK